jgi:hypothetical protein
MFIYLYYKSESKFEPKCILETVGLKSSTSQNKIFMSLTERLFTTIAKQKNNEKIIIVRKNFFLLKIIYILLKIIRYVRVLIKPNPHVHYIQDQYQMKILQNWTRQKV